MNHATYTKNGAAFLSSDNKAQFLANEWMSAQKKIKSETNAISSNIGDKEGQYHLFQAHCARRRLLGSAIADGHWRQ